MYCRDAAFLTDVGLRLQLMLGCAKLELKDLDIAALAWPEHDPALAAKHGGRYRTRPEEQQLLQGPVIHLQGDSH